jgi:hypothetical protein
MSQVGFAKRIFGRLPACQTILKVIGNLLTDGCQVEEVLFHKDVFGFFGKLPIHCRLVPKVMIPIHASHSLARPPLEGKGDRTINRRPWNRRGSAKRAANLHHVGNEFHVSNVVQLSAEIAPRGFVLPKHLNLMSSDADNRAGSAGLMIVFADPDDAVAQR